MALTRPITWGAAFHAQQCVEKSIKSYLMWRQIPFPPKHDIALLLESCERDVADGLGGTVWLSQFAVRARYPLPTGDPTLEQAMTAIDAAAKSLEFITNRLKSDGTI